MSLRFYSADSGLDINIDDPAGRLMIARGGYAQAWDPDAAEVWEEVVAEWFTTSSDTLRAQDLRELHQIGLEARRKSNRHDPAFYDLAKRPRVEARTVNESFLRYAILQDLVIPSLDPKHYGPGQAKLKIKLLRENPWRFNTAPGSYTTLSPATIEAHDVGGAANYADVTPPGTADAPIPLVLTLDRSPMHGSLIVAVRPRQTGSGPFFWFASTRSSVSSGWTQTASAAVPGSQYLYRIDGGGSGGGWIEWTHADPVNLYGRFQVWVLCVGAGPDEWRVKFSHGINEAAGFWSVGDWFPVDRAGTIGADDYGLSYAGTVQIPGASPVPGETFADYKTRITFDMLSASSELDVAGFLLVPIDGQIYRIDQANLSTDSDQVVINGDMGRTFARGSGEITRPHVDTFGPFPALIPGGVNRIYIYNWPASTAYDLSGTLSLTVAYASRVAHL